jgi:8-oxo-dGTP diphosphatase
VVRRVPGVGAVVRDDDGRLLLVLRARAPAAGTWSLPGGRVEPGEDDATATAREVREETGLTVSVERFVGAVRRDGPGGVRYDIRDYACRPTGGTLVPGDDAADARWWAPEDVRRLPTSPGLVEALEAWGQL